MDDDLIDDLLGGNSMLGDVGQYASPCRCACHKPDWEGNKAGECPNCLCAECPYCREFFDSMFLDLHISHAHPEAAVTSVGRVRNSIMIGGMF